MKPTEILENEHRIIEQVLACLEATARISQKSGCLDCDAVRLMVDFFRNFADRFHHAKEERHLFPALEAHGMPREGGPTGVMLAEHEMGREFTGKMEKAARSFEAGDASSVKDFVSAAQGYITLLREHIQKEDHCLFAMTNNALGEDEQERLADAFRNEEAKIPEHQGYEHYRQLACDLERRFGGGDRSSRMEMPSSCPHHGSCSGF